MNKMTGLFIFAAGAAVGSVVTWQYTKGIYERRAQEEIDSVKSTFSRRSADSPVKAKAQQDTSQETEAAKVDKIEEKPDIFQYAKILEEEKYVTADKSAVAEQKPYVISPDEFGEFDEYETISLTYYADQVLADENDEEIKNADDVVGMESLTHFGEYEDDSVFVRNDRLKCDYEILMNNELYSDVLKTKPRRMGG